LPVKKDWILINEVVSPNSNWEICFYPLKESIAVFWAKFNVSIVVKG